MKDEKWVLLWSQSQCALHVERLRDTFRSNTDAFLEDRRMDYVPLVIGTRQEVDIAADAARPTVYARDSVRNGSELNHIPAELLP